MNTLDLDTLTLAAGSHDPGDGEMCVMEAAAFVAGEEWTDRPECASPVIGAFMRAWNDALPDDDRQDLKRYILRLVDSKGTPEQEDLRGWMALDWLVRVHAPVWLRLAGLDEHADRLAGFAEIRPDTVRRVKPTLDAALEAAYAARGAAMDTVMAAVRAAEIAAWDAVGTAAWDIAKTAARAVAGAAARGTAGIAAGVAAWAAARAVAGAAARGTAGIAAGVAAWAAARAVAAAEDAKELTHRELQQSAHDLVDRMLAVTEGDPA